MKEFKEFKELQEFRSAGRSPWSAASLARPRSSGSGEVAPGFGRRTPEARSAENNLA